ncbi:efflux RND transporter periplasmic adaptor subunit [Shewanella sp. A14]
MDNYSPIKLSYLALALTSILFIAPMTQAEEAKEVIKAPEYTRPVKLMRVGNSVAQLNKTFPAKVAANKQVDLAFRVNGQLTHLDLLAGQQVKKGQLLAQLDNRDAKNSLLNAQANHQLATVDFTRKEKLLAKHQISKSEFDTAKANLQSTLATFQSAKDQLSYTTLSAPFSGMVAKVDIENYQMLQASQVVLTLQDNKQFDITFNVPESYLFNLKSLNLKANQEKYTVKFNGCPDYFYATYKEMNTVINNGSQTYQIILSFTPPADLSILPGMSAEVSINGNANNLPITILPLTAIVHDEQAQHDYVWVYQDQTKTLKKAIVELGKIRTKGTEILSGLTHGDQVVAVGANAIDSDTKVSPLHWERGV